MRKNKSMKLLALAMAVIMLAAVLTGCELIMGGAKVTVSISQETAEVAVGETLQLTATASDGSDVEWSSSDKTVVSVTRDGLIRGAKAGTATITAKSGEATATCEVTVCSVDVTISKTTATIEIGQSITLTAEAEDGGEIVWSSSDEKIATVENGVVTGLKEGKAIITAKRAQAGAATCEVTVVWTDKPEDYAVIGFGEEGPVAVANPGTYYYWNDQNWCGSSVTALDAYYAGGVATFQYADASPACWHGYQVFYKHAANVAGQAYKLTAKINSLEAGDITINGTVVILQKGENNVEVYYVEDGGKASISIQMGNSAAGTVIAANTISISDIGFEEFTPEKLAAPTEVSISADKVVSITDSNGNKKNAIKLNFYKDGGMLYSVQIVNGGKLDDSAMEDGTYEIKAIAIGSGAYESSDESGVLATYTVANGGVSYDMEGSGETGAVANPGKWVYWTEFSGITYAKYENGKISFDVSVEGGNWYSNQLFYKNSALQAGKAYTITMKMTSTVAGQITINGNVVTLTEGVNEIKISGNEGNVSISIQMGTMDSTGATASTIATGEFTIENIEFTEGAGSTDPETPNAVIAGGEVDAVANPDKAYYWTEFAGIANATYVDGVISFNVINGGNWYSNQIFLKKSDLTAGKSYKLTMTVVSSVAEKITVNGAVIDLIVGENAVEVTYVEDASKASLSLQCGVNGGVSLAAGEFTLKDILYTEVEGGNEGDGGEDTPDTPPTDPTSYDIVFGEEGTTVANPGKWYYWNDQGWCGSNVNVSGAHYDLDTDKATFSYSGMTTACWFGMQIFYENPNNVDGTTYKLTCTITSDVAGDIAIKGQKVTLVAGENNIELIVVEGDEVNYNDTPDASFVLHCGTSAGTVIAENTISISNLTFTAIEDDGEDEGEGSEGGDPVTPPSGSYTIVYADENGTVADPGVWHFWNDQWWCGSNVTVSSANYDAENDKASFTYSLEGSCSFGMQVFYKNSANAVGTKYTLTCTITSEAAGDITINQQAVTLVVGENRIELTVTESAAASFSLQCGNIAANTFSISGLTFTEVVEGGNEGDGEGSTDTPATSYVIGFGGEGDTVTNPGKWIYWNDQNWCGSNVIVSSANYDAENDKATFTYSGATTACWHGMQIFYKNPANETGKSYIMTCTITSEVAGDVTILGHVVTLVAGENNIELQVGQGGTSSFSLQCGNAAGTVIEANTISISGLTFTEM